jgi:hypothetical protein
VPFDSQLLFPLSSDYTPIPAQVLRFFDRLIDIGTLARESAIKLRLPTEEEVYVRNPRTGERMATGLKRLKDAPIGMLAEAERLLAGIDQYVLTVQSSGTVAASSFELCEQDGFEADPSKTCVVAVRCVVRDRRNQLSEPWHEHLRTFLLPPEKRAGACPRCGAIHEPGEEVEPRFWIEFVFSGAYLPSFKHASKEFDPTIYDAATRAFQTHFFHGRFFA